MTSRQLTHTPSSQHTHFSLPLSVCDSPHHTYADWNLNTHSHSWLLLLYFECAYRVESEWQRSIPQSGTSASSFPVSNLVSPTHPHRPSSQSERGPVRTRANQSAGGWFSEGCEGNLPRLFRPVTRLTQTHTHTLHNHRKENQQDLTRNNSKDTLSIHPQTQKSPIKHFHSYTRHNNGRKPGFYQRTLSFRGWWVRKTRDVHTED